MACCLHILDVSLVEYLLLIDYDSIFVQDEEENKLRENLRKEWEENQRRIKEESIDITFSYWDGSGHRRSITMKKGRTIYQFLQKVVPFD